MSKSEDKFDKMLDNIRNATDGGYKITSKTIKGENKMQKSNNKTIIITVVITILTIVAFALTFWGGIAFEQARQDQVRAEAKTIVDELSVKTKQ